MYLSLNHPAVLPVLQTLAAGLWAAKVGDEYALVVKAPKEVILTAKVNKGFCFYLAPVEMDSTSSFALVTAFYDSEDEPLTIRTPLLSDDSATNGLISLFASDEFNVFFFDEHNREMLSYRAAGNLGAMRTRLVGAQMLEANSVPEMLGQAERWFSNRQAQDDHEAIRVQLVEPLMPDDFLILDLDIDRHRFLGSKSFSSTSLEREQPGAYQENDIVFLLQRTFPSDRIFVNPVKESDGKEFVDILVLGDRVVYLVQAKDSPNTAETLRTTVKRKRTRSISQMAAAAKQLQGAISFAKRSPVLRFVLENDIIEVDTTNAELIGIVVVKELFNDSFREYSDMAFRLAERTQTPVVFFDYPELNSMTLHCRNEGKFLGTIDQILQAAKDVGEYPRLRYSGKPP